MVYGEPATGSEAVGKLSVKVPVPAVMAAEFETWLTVIDTLPTGTGTHESAVIVPDSVVVDVPYTIEVEGATLK